MASFGRTLTPFGPVGIQVTGDGHTALVSVEGQWRGAAPLLDVRLPGYAPQSRAATESREEFQLSRAS
jgi:hypothetical protein